jgi:hypothetical protein
MTQNKILRIYVAGIVYVLANTVYAHGPSPDDLVQVLLKAKHNCMEFRTDQIIDQKYYFIESMYSGEMMEKQNNGQGGNISKNMNSKEKSEWASLSPDQKSSMCEELSIMLDGMNKQIILMAEATISKCNSLIPEYPVIYKIWNEKHLNVITGAMKDEQFKDYVAEAERSLEGAPDNEVEEICQRINYSSTYQPSK